MPLQDTTTIASSSISSSVRIPSLLRHASSNDNNSESEKMDTFSSVSNKLQQYVDDRKKDKKEEEDIIRMFLLYTRLTNLVLNRTFVKTSTIHDRGLFAKFDCRKGDVLTCYPGDALIIIPDEEEEEWTILWGNHVDTATQKKLNVKEDLLGYIVHAKNDVGILGLPSLDEDSSYLGHFANDGAVNIPYDEMDLASYMIESEEKANAMHKDIYNECHMVTVATRDIKAGEEIFVTYGPDYWSEQPQFNNDDDDDNYRSSPSLSSSSNGRGFG